MQRRKFSREFKVEAVRLVRDRGVSAAQAARDLDVHENVLRKWVKEFAAAPAGAFPGHGQVKPEQLEIDRLRREVTKLKAERDILKKAAAFFAREATPGECPAPATEVCIDDYLWAIYERAPKIDTNKVVERVKVRAKVTIKEKKKTRTVTKTFIKTNTKYVLGDFTWKDPIAAKKSGMSLKDYVIGGMDPSFKLKLYRALRAMDDAGHMPGITSAFRDDYRQSIASGHKVASDSSYHGGSRRGGYGHGLAADLVSVKGENRSQRYAATQELWKWIDAHEKELGMARPYLNRDPPHVAPLDGAEYAAKRGRVIAQKPGMQTKKHDRVAGLPPRKCLNCRR